MAPTKRQSFRLRLRALITPDQETSPSTSSTPQIGRQEVGTNWRQKMKIDRPRLYDSYKNHDAAAARLRRLEKKVKLDQPGNEHLKEEERVKKNQRMRQYREQKKLEEQERGGEESREAGEEKKRKTRASTEKEQELRERDTNRQRLRRARMTKREREEVNKKRREQRRMEREYLDKLVQEREALEAEKANEAKRLQQEEQRLMEEWMRLEKAKESNKSPSERKRLSRARRSIPKDPVLYAATVTSLIDEASPRKKKLLRKSKPGVRTWSSHVSETLAAEMRSLQKSRKKADLERKRTIAATLKITKRYRLQRQTCKALRISRKLLTNNRKQAHKRKVTPATTKAVHLCYESHSIVLPHKRYVSKKTHKPAGFLTLPVSSIYCSFRKDNPGIQIGLSKFMSMRPPHIKLRKSIKYRGCLCEYCANMELKVDAINKLAHLHQLPSPFSNLYNFNAVTMCKRETGYNRLECIQRKCDDCGVHKIREHLTALMEKPGLITWKKWERESKIDNGKKTSKMALQTKEGNVNSLVEEMEMGAESFAQHLFSAAWQNARYSDIAKKPPQGCVVMVYDFAENYSCRYQDEVQSVHWGHEAATLHPIVCSYQCPTCSETVTHSLVMISNDNTHDHHAVHQFTRVAMDHLGSELADIGKVIRFSDGAPSQYKSRGPFMDVSSASEEYGVHFQHEFFGSRHGKGPSDSESGVIKRLATDAVMAGTAVIRNAQEMFEFVSKNATRPSEEPPSPNCHHFRRDVFWVPKEAILRNRPSAEKTVVGTRLIHSVLSVKTKVIATRSLSCFCPPCLEGIEGCHNTHYVEPYVEVSLERGVTIDTVQRYPLAATRPSNTPEAQLNEGTTIVCSNTEDSTDVDNGATDECSPKVPSVGDFVRVRVPRLGKKSTDGKFVAKVLGITDDRYHLTYMDQKGSLFTWPSGEESVYIHPPEDIIETLQPPQPVAMGSRIFFKFS